MKRDQSLGVCLFSVQERVGHLICPYVCLYDASLFSYVSSLRCALAFRLQLKNDDSINESDRQNQINKCFDLLFRW